MIPLNVQEKYKTVNAEYNALQGECTKVVI